MSKFLESKNVYLKKLSTSDDLDNYLKMVNEVKELSYVDELGRYPFNKNDLEKYINNVSGLFLSIFNNNNEHVGNIRVNDIHPVNRYCSFGILLNKKYRGNGYSKEASQLVIDHLFRNLNVHRLELFVAKQNIPAINLYESLGFKQEGCKRESIWINGKYDDLIVYSMLIHDIERKGK